MDMILGEQIKVLFTQTQNTFMYIKGRQAVNGQSTMFVLIDFIAQ